MAITTDQIKELRELTGAGIMDCKRALSEADGDVEQARRLLRQRGAEAAAKKVGREARQGVVAAYIHSNNGIGRIGALVEVNCETDFVARTEQFQQLAQRIAQHIVAAAPEYLSEDEVPADLDELARARAIRDQVLVNQRFQAGSQTVNDLLQEAVGVLGENIRVGRFTRYVLGGE